MRLLALLPCGALLVAACAGTVTTENTSGTTSGSGSTTVTTGSTTSTSSTSSTGSGGSGGGMPMDCQARADAIAQQVGGAQACTALVRLDYGTKAIKGYRLLCAPYGVTTEAAARATAQADTGFGQTGQLLSGPQPMDHWVFWNPAGDFGGTGVVSVRSGTSMFGGSTVWGGAGDITYPTSFDPPEQLGLGCNSQAPKPTSRGFDLGGGQPLGAGDVSAAIDVVWSTALPDGLWKNSYVFDAMVLLYPRSVGAVDPTSTEYIVLVDTGWLE